MAALVAEQAFTADVDLFAEACAAPACGLALALSTEWVGSIGEQSDGTPVARLFHLACAPAVLRAAHGA